MSVRLIALALATMAFAAWAPAARASVLVVSGGTKADPVGAGAVELGRSRRWVVVDRRDPPPRSSRLPASIGRAISAYHAFRYVEALEHLDRARSLVEAGELSGVDNTSLADLFIYRGLVRYALGDKDGVWSEFVSAATLSPTRILDPVRFPPTAVETFSRALDEVRKQPRGEIAFSADPECTVFVDGASYSIPTGLPYGTHYYIAACPGHQQSGRVEVSGSRIDIVIDSKAERPVRLEDVIAEGKKRGAKQVFWVRVDRTKVPSALVVSHRLAMKETRRRVVEASAEAVSAALTELAEVAPPVAATSAETTAAKSPWYKSPWLWAAVGAATAAAIIIPITYQGEESTTFAVEPSGSLP